MKSLIFFDESVTLLRYRLGYNIAKDFAQMLKESNLVSIISISDKDEGGAWEIFLKYNDQDFSYTDCTSFCAMERLKINTAFTFDNHFAVMKFQVVPN